MLVGWLGLGAMGAPMAAGSLAFLLAVTRLSPRKRTTR